MRDYSGIISKWQIHHLSDGRRVLTGTVVEDYKGRWSCGMHMRSSVITYIVDDVVHTSNSAYLLAGPEGDTTLGGDMGDDVTKIFY
jgi:hypothetical protein